MARRKPMLETGNLPPLSSIAEMTESIERLDRIELTDRQKFDEIVELQRTYRDRTTTFIRDLSQLYEQHIDTLSNIASIPNKELYERYKAALQESTTSRIQDQERNAAAQGSIVEAIVAEDRLKIVREENEQLIQDNERLRDINNALIQLIPKETQV